MKRSQIAAQLYTVRDHCRTAAELAASAAKLKAIGYGAVQVSGVGPIPEAEIVRILTGEGLTICATHEPGATIVSETQKVIDRLGALGCAYTAYPWPHVPLDSLTATGRLAADLERAGAAMARAQQVLTYHNHAVEFRKVGSGAAARTVLELLYAMTSPQHLQGEIDTYWIQAGGGDPAGWCTRLQGRLPLLHLKDLGVREANQATTMEIGQGNLDWPGIIAAADRAGCRWFIVEQDTCPGDPFESLAISLRYLTGLAERDERSGAGATARAS